MISLKNPRRLLAVLVLTAASLDPFAAAARAAETGDRDYTRRVAIVVHDGVELLDFAGPGEVFAAAAGFGADRGRDAFDVYTVSPDGEPIVSQGFVTVDPQYGVADAPPPDLIVIPGGGSSTLTGSAEFMAWLKERLPQTEIVLTVCTGAFVLGEAGGLEGRPATTWYNAVDGLRERFPGAEVHEGRRFVDSGEVVTTAGVSAGIDGSLHVVARLLGRDVAQRTAQYMEYRWMPESFLARDYALLNPSTDETGRRLQAAAMRGREGDWVAAAAAYRRAAEEVAADDGEPWLQLGTALHRAGDREGAVEAMRRATEFEATRGRASYNLACLHALAGETDAALDRLERAVASGAVPEMWLRHDPDLASLREEARFRALLSGE